MTVADVMHADVASLPSTATVAELRDWFAVSASRRLAVIADDGRYAGSLTPGDVGAGAPADTPALGRARPHATVAPEVPAVIGRDLALASEARRVPVVDAEGHFLGVLALTTDLEYFACRPAPAPE